MSINEKAFEAMLKRAGVKPENMQIARKFIEEYEAEKTHQPDERTAHELSMERIAHDHTKAKLKATEEAYKAMLNAPERESGGE